MKITVAILALLVTGLVSAQTYTVDAEKSTLKWHGKKVTGEHLGHIDLDKGSFKIANNKIVEGSFTIDMSSITNTDIEAPEFNAKLVGHLKSDDFFGVEKYPTATLKIKSASAFKDGVANVTADLTIKGKTHPSTFKVKKNGNEFTAFITVDRSKYDVRYGSTSFFDNLGDKAIYDEFTLDVKIAVN